MILCGLTDAPIPWPTGKKRQKGPGARAIVVYGALAEAVRRESAQAVAHWFGVTNQTHDARSCALLGCCGLPYSGGGGSPAVGAVVPGAPCSRPRRRAMSAERSGRVPPPNPQNSGRRVRLNQLWAELPDENRRAALHALSRLLASRLRPPREGKEAADDQAK